jgi:hypothetical protein
MSRWTLLPVHLGREVNGGGTGGGVRVTEMVGESRIEDHVEKEEIRTVGGVSNENNHKRSCPKMWDLNLWEGGMLGVILPVEGEVL